MRRQLLSGPPIGLLMLLLGAGCTFAPPPGGQAVPSSVEVLPADARALQYGSSAPELFNSPQIRDKVRALFGSDWSPAAEGGGRLQYGAVSYFPGTSAIRMLRIDNQDYVAITGCVPSACNTHRGLVLIRSDGDQLWARLDEGGFSKYYGHGPAMMGAVVSPAFIDSAWRAVDRVDRTAAATPLESAA